MKTPPKISWASVFLSHSSKDKGLVTDVATELTQRGVIPWFDVNELQASHYLSWHLERAIQKQAGFVVFLSEASIASSWVEDELETALKMEKKRGEEIIIPIYLGNALQLVQSHPLLRSRWLNVDGDRVEKRGIFAASQDNGLNPGKIAEDVALRIFDLLDFDNQRDVVLYLDQRGAGKRTGFPRDMPDNLNRLNCPGMIFRPDLGDRQRNDVLTEDDWKTIAAKMFWSFERALGNTTWPDTKKIRIIGNAQLALPFLVGHYFSRNTNANLFCYHHSNTIFTNKDQNRNAPLKRGNAQCYTEYNKIPPFPDDFKGETLALFLMHDYLLPNAISHWKKNTNGIPGIWVKNGRFKTKENVMSYIADVVALLQRMKKQHNISSIRLYTELPFNVLPLLAANLFNVIHKIEFMEFRINSNFTGEELYTKLLIYDPDYFKKKQPHLPNKTNHQKSTNQPDISSLDQWDLGKQLFNAFPNLSINFDRRVKKDLLQIIAYTILTHLSDKSSTNYINAAILTKPIKKYLQELEITAPQNIAQMIIKQLPTSNYILYDQNANGYTFKDHIFLEFFCAAEIVYQFNARNIDELKLIDLFDSYYKEKVWHNVFCMVCNQIDEKFIGKIVTHLVKKVISKGDNGENISAIFLAISCISKVRKTGKEEVKKAIQCLRNYLVDHLHPENKNSTSSNQAITAWFRFFKAIKIDQIEQFVYDEHPRIRESALAELATRRKNERTHLLLILRAIQDEDKYLRKAALQEVNKKWPEDKMYQVLIQQSVQNNGDFSYSKILLALINKYPNEKRTINSLLKQQVIQDKNRKSRSSALQILAEKWLDEKTREFIVERAIDDPSGHLRNTALQILAEKWLDEKTREFIVKRAVDDPSEHPRSTALQILAEKWLGEKTREFIVKRAVDDPSEHPRSTALQILAKKWPNGETRKFIMTYADKEDIVKYPWKTAFQILAEKWPDGETRKFIMTCADKEGIVKYPWETAFQILAEKWPDGETRKFIMTCADKEDIVKYPWKTTLEILAEKWPDEKTREFFMAQAVQDFDENLQNTTLEILAEKWSDEKTREFIMTQAIEVFGEYPRITAMQILSKKWSDDKTRAFIMTRAIEDFDEKPRNTALEILAKTWMDEKTRKFIMIRAIEDIDDETRNKALQILARKWPDEITQKFIMIRAVEDEDEKTRKDAFKTCLAHIYISWATSLL